LRVVVYIYYILLHLLLLPSGSTFHHNCHGAHSYLKAFDVNLIYYKQIRDLELEKQLAVKYVSFNQFLKVSDIILCMHALDATTIAFIGVVLGICAQTALPYMRKARA